MTFYLKLYGLVLVCMLSINLIFAQEVPQDNIEISDTPIPLDPQVRTGTLDNGFTYYIRRNTEPEERVTFYLAMKAGSILEADNEQGLAHFLEHMAFNGTRHFPKNELISYLQSNGVRFGADLNAYTSFDETVFQLPIPSDDPEIIRNGMQILRDWAGDISLDEEDINAERGVIIEEKRGHKGAAERMRLKYMPMILNHSRYADRSPIGIEDVLLNFKPETIRQFYKKWYRPDLQGLIVVGDIQVDSIEAMVREKFSDLKNPEHAPERTHFQIPLKGQNDFMVVTDPENPSLVLQMMIKHPGDTLVSTKDYRATLVNGLFNSMMNARMSELRKQADPPFLGGGASIGGFLAGLDAGSVVAAVKPESGTLERGFKAVLTELQRVQQFGFTQTELDRVKKALLSYKESSYKERDKTNSNSYVSEYLRHFLTGEASPGIAYEYAFYQQVLPGITLDEVNAVASRYFGDTNRDILIMAPEKLKDSLPDEQQVLQWMQAVTQDSIKAYEDTVSGMPLLENEPEPGRIVQEKTLQEVDATEMTLSNGIKVVIKQTDFKNDQIQFTAFSPGGNTLYGDADYPSAENATGLISSSGLGHFNAVELPKVLSGKIVKVTPYIGSLYEGIAGASSPEDLSTAMKLIYLYFTAPKVDQDIFKGLITNYKSSLSTRSDNPNSVFGDTIRNVLGNYAYRTSPPSLQKADAISLDRAYEIYKERFADASDFTFFFVGNINADTIRPLIERYLGSLPSLKRKEAGKDLGIYPPEGHLRKVVYKGSEEKATVQLVFNGPYTYDADRNMAMNALEEVLNIRLIERLREVEAGVYTPGVSVSYQKEPAGRYSAAVYFTCAPDHVDPLIQATLEEIKHLQEQGPRQADLDKFKSEARRSRETALETNGFWLNYLSARYRLGEPLDKLDGYSGHLEQLKMEDVQHVAQETLNSDRLIEFILLPEDKKQ